MGAERCLLNAMILTIHVSEPVTQHDFDWKAICEGVVFRRELSFARGHSFFTHRRGADAAVMRPPDLSDEQAQALENAVSSECDEAIRKARVARAVTALESVERVYESLATTSRAVEAIREGLTRGKSVAEIGEIAVTWLPRVVTAWAWIQQAVRP